MSKNLIRYMSQILIALLEESASIPSGVLDIIVDQFTNHAVRSNLVNQINY